MQLTPSTAEIYLRHAFGQMLRVAERVGDERVNERPLGSDTNAIAALIIHCCSVSDFWFGHVALGHPNRRDREAEFSRTATVAELHQIVDDAVSTALTDIRALEAGEGKDEGGRQFLPGGDGSDGAVVLHVLEECFQHLGHMELAADALRADRR
ncbi:MAG: DinB family protein [Acidimicrobiales bacterium]